MLLLRAWEKENKRASGRLERRMNKDPEHANSKDPKV
jgi:hypothetical protein